MNYEDVIRAWNDQADGTNDWGFLGEDEKIEFAVKLERESCAKVCEEKHTNGNWKYDTREDCAAAIRERSN